MSDYFLLPVLYSNEKIERLCLYGEIVMKLGIIGDIHANLEALTVTLDLLIKQERVDRIFCLGDIVGYNANPAECIELLWKHEVSCISGNHDRFVTGEIDAVIRPETRHVIEFTRSAIGKEKLDFIASLPEEQYFEDICLFVHGSPRHKDEYINSLQVARGNLQSMRRDRPYVSVCFYGHTHLPYVIADSLIETDIHKNVTYELERKYQYLLNPGSVGQPRDQCPSSSCAVFDLDEFTVSYFRTEYDISVTQQKILAAGLSPKIAERLAKGR